MTSSTPMEHTRNGGLELLISVELICTPVCMKYNISVPQMFPAALNCVLLRVLDSKNPHPEARSVPPSSRHPRTVSSQLVSPSSLEYCLQPTSISNQFVSPSVLELHQPASNQFNITVFSQFCISPAHGRSISAVSIAEAKTCI